MTAEVGETTQAGLLRRLNLAKSILGQSSSGDPAVQMALKALDGSLPVELAADKRWHEMSAANGEREQGCEGCLGAWGDGWHTGYEEGIRRRHLIDAGGA